MADECRQVKIKTGSLKRLRKELEMYQAEKEQEQAKVQELTDQGADFHDIKHAENVLAESVAMVPDTRQRLEAALAELQGLLEELDAPLQSSEEAQVARAEVAAAKAVFAQ